MELFTNSNSLPKIDLRVVLPGSIRKTTLIELSSSERLMFLMIYAQKY